LLARLQAVLKRVHNLNQAKLRVYGIELDEDEQTVTVDGSNIQELTAIEFRLLRYFMLNTGKVLSKAQLGEHVYSESTEPDSNVLEVYVKRLRKIVGNDLIHTRRSQGYFFGLKS
jgi:DNA-binding response OmpR family regulator